MQLPQSYQRWSDGVRCRHGRRQAWLRSCFYRMAAEFGAYRSLEAVEWPRVSRLIFVCSGNICRSAYAEARACAMGVSSSSCGLDATRGTPADPSAVRVAARRGVDLSAHASREVSDLTLSAADLLVAHEPQQISRLRRIAAVAGSGAQLTLIGLWTAEANPYVADPYGLCQAYFESCFSTIDVALRKLAERLDSRGADNAERRSS